ncbi:MAG TPA: LLM class flavin-dependent oxidoreductase [Acidimicrobiales bacterium]
MTVDVYWTLPVGGRHGGGPAPALRVTDLRPGRFSDFDHQRQAARAAEATGFAGLVVPYDTAGDESWVTATALAREVPRLRLVPEFQPGFATAVYSAKLAQSFQRFFADRLGWKLSLDPPEEVQRRVGDTVIGADRLARAAELLEVVSGVWAGHPYSYEGRWFTVQDGGFWGGPQTADGGRQLERRPPPIVFLDGADDARLDLSARWADVHLFDLDEPAALAESIDRHGQRAAAHGRTVRYGVRLPIWVREHADEAWRDLRRAWDRSGPGGPFPDSPPATAGGESHWPGLWRRFDGLGLRRPAGLVGTFDEMAAWLRDLVELGASVLVLEGAAPIEDAYRLGEFVLPSVLTSTTGVPA